MHLKRRYKIMGHVREVGKKAQRSAFTPKTESQLLITVGVTNFSRPFLGATARERRLWIGGRLGTDRQSH